MVALKCSTCPLEEDHHCRGELARRLCELVNPVHPAYDPAYRVLLNVPASEMPSFAQQAGNALAAAGRAVGAALAGEPVIASTELQERRWAICLACEHLENEKCKLCGCHMRLKSALAQERCPIAKW